MLQYVYNINGITWLCRQFSQLQCYPITNPWDSPPPGLATATPPHPEHPAPAPAPQEESQARSLGPDSRRLTWEYQNQLGGDQPPSPSTQTPPFKRTTFCSRAIRFIARDEAVLRSLEFTHVLTHFNCIPLKNQVSMQNINVQLQHLLRRDEDVPGRCAEVWRSAGGHLQDAEAWGGRSRRSEY